MQDFKYAPGKGGNPTIKDPVPTELPYSHSSFPSFDALDAIINVLGDALGIEICSLAVYLYVLVVEVNEKDYDLHKLPGKVAGRSTLWGIKGNTWGKKRADFPRKKVPTGLVVDDSNYKSDGLSPGVKVCGKFKATSGGALIRNIITSEQRITVAERGWGVNENPVFHPDLSQEIGTITDRYPLYDVALCRLDPGLTYTNNKYFSAPLPSHFLNSDDYILKTHPWTWFGVDGFTTGLVWLDAAGIIKHRGRDAVKLTSQNALILRKALASKSELASTPADGICGAPVVHQEDEDPILDCGCVGFFSEYDGINALVPTIDHLVEKGWEIVKN